MRFVELKSQEQLSPLVVKLIGDMRTQWSELDHRIEDFNKEFVTFVKAYEEARLLVSIPGIGVMIASALIAAIGKAESFARDATSRPGSVWFRSNRHPVVTRDFPVSASEETNTSESW